jgi:hypothetical protein
VKGGVAGVVLDARGRPITIEREERARVQQLQQWAKAMRLYPELPTQEGVLGAQH